MLVQTLSRTSETNRWRSCRGANVRSSRRNCDIRVRSLDVLGSV